MIKPSVKEVQRAIGQDAMKEHGQLCGGLVAIVLCEFEHAVLHDIEGRFLVTDVVDGAFKRTFFHAFQEFG